MPNVGILLHRILYPCLKTGFVLSRKHKFIYQNQKPQISGNAIYAFNHSCKFDTQHTCEIIGKQAYILAGVQRLEPFDRVAFHLIGTVWVDRKSKDDKKNSVNKMIKLLNENTNLIIFPEGTWNLTPSKPTLPLYWGVIDLARTTHKPIVPVVLEYKHENCYVSFGKVMNISPDDDKAERIEELKEQFSTMKWELWRKYPDIGFDTAEEWDNEVRRRLEEYPKLDIVYETSVIRKVFDPADEVFEHLDRIVPTKNNAFIFNKNNHF